MHLRHLQLVDFRSYPEVDVALEPGVTAFVGSNGQGKTNLIEAVGYAATQSSHRVAADAPLVRGGAEQAIVRAVVVRDARETTIELAITPGKTKRAKVNRAPVPRAREALGILRTVLFAPEDLALVKGDPDGRRRFLDDLLVVRAPRYAGVLSDYDRVLRQRNTLLRQAGGRLDGAAASTLEVWDAQLVTLGAELLAARLYLLALLARPVRDAYLAVCGTDGLALLGYRASIDDDLSTAFTATLRRAADAEEVSTPGREDLAAAMGSRLAALRDREVARGVTLAGPHRDDLDLILGDFPAKGYASHGESWSFALALRLASYELLKADSSTADGEPVLILDDVFAELDANRRRRLAELVSPAEQVLLTAAVDADIPAELAGARIRVTTGAASRED